MNNKRKSLLRCVKRKWAKRSNPDDRQRIRMFMMMARVDKQRLEA